MTGQICSRRIRSDFREIHDLTAWILGKADELGFGEETIRDLRVALDEAIANAAIHGNSGDPEKRITVKCFLHENGALEIRVRDEGLGFDARRVPDPTHGENLLAPHGRGIFLIRHYMDRVFYNRKGNEVRMWKKPRRGGQPPPSA